MNSHVIEQRKGTIIKIEPFFTQHQGLSNFADKAEVSCLLVILHNSESATLLHFVVGVSRHRPESSSWSDGIRDKVPPTSSMQGVQILDYE